MKFSISRMKGIIGMIPYLRRGENIRKPSGYTSAPQSKGTKVSTIGQFVVPAETYVEVSRSIEKAGLWGLLMELAYGCGEEDKLAIEQHIANAMNMDINEVDRRVNDALAYISNSEKSRTFDDWKNHRKGGR